jgi:hypothetical protein
MMDFEDSFDDDYEAWDDDYGDAEFEDAEFEELTLGEAYGAKKGVARPAVRRAKPHGSATSSVQGRQYGIVKTPRGNARVELPGKFPTVNEFKQSIAKLQQDIKANSTGIAQLTERLKQDATLEAGARVKSDRALRRSLKRTQVAALIAATLPVFLEMARPEESRAFSEVTP